jgi:hypothetical protein
MKNDSRQPTQMDWLCTVEFIPDDDVVGNALRDGLQKSSGASRKQSIISTNVAIFSANRGLERP